MAKTAAKKRPKSKYNPSDLLGFCQSEVIIECSVKGCKEVDGDYMTDEEWAVEEFFRKGWRATKDYCYCPKHAKLKLKNA